MIKKCYFGAIFQIMNLYENEIIILFIFLYNFYLFAKTAEKCDLLVQSIFTWKNRNVQIREISMQPKV